MILPPKLRQACLARIPISELAVLGDLRLSREIRVASRDGAAWVRWSPADESVVLRLLAASSVEWFDRGEDGWWRRSGTRTPLLGFEPPAPGDGVPLASALVPDRVDPIAPGPLRSALVRLRLVTETQPRPASALRCSLQALAAWADDAATPWLERLQGAIHLESREALVWGERLPPLPGARRYWSWGPRLLVPLGLRPEPALPEAAILAAWEAGEDEIVIFEPNAEPEALPREVLRPLTRAGIRLAVLEAQGRPVSL